MSHKGDWSRVNNHKAYQDNYELIFKRAKDRPEEIQVCAEDSSRPNQQGKDREESNVTPRDTQANT